MAAGGERTVRFLSSHPASAERVESMRALAAELQATSAPPQAEVEYSFHDVRIHGALFAEADARVFVKELPQGTRSTLMPGDRIVGCYGAAPQYTTLWTLAACRSPDGGYAFLVERDADQVAAVLLRPRN
jgi:predicted Zn-dependent protease